MKRSKFTTVLGACLAVSMMASACSSKKDGKSANDTKKTDSETSEITEVTDESETDPKETKETMTSETTKQTDPTTASTAESTTEKETGSGETTLWQLDDSLKFEDHIPTYTSAEVETEKGKKITLYTAQIGDGYDSVIPALKEDAWIKSLGSLTDYYKENGERGKGDGTPWRFSYANGLSSAAPMEKGSDGVHLGTAFQVLYQYNTVQFTGASFVSVKFSNLDFSDPAVQENVFRVVKSVYGDDLGTLLLYGKETNAEKAAEKPNNMNVSVKKDNMSIRFTRTASDLDTDYANLYFCVHMNPGKAPNVYYQGDYKPLAESFGALPNDVLGGNIGNQNILDPATFANKFYNGSSEASESTVDYTFERWISQDDRAFYNMEFNLMNLHLSYSVGTVNGDADKYTVGSYGDTCKFPAVSEKGEISAELMTELNRRLEVLSGVDQKITIDQLEQSNNNKAHYNGRVRLTFIVMGHNTERDYIISADGNDHDPNDGHWRAE